MKHLKFLIFLIISLIIIIYSTLYTKQKLYINEIKHGNITESYLSRYYWEYIPTKEEKEAYLYRLKNKHEDFIYYQLLNWTELTHDNDLIFQSSLIYNSFYPNDLESKFHLIIHKARTKILSDNDLKILKQYYGDGKNNSVSIDFTRVVCPERININSLKDLVLKENYTELLNIYRSVPLSDIYKSCSLNSLLYTLDNTLTTKNDSNTNITSTNQKSINNKVFVGNKNQDNLMYNAYLKDIVPNDRIVVYGHGNSQIIKVNETPIRYKLYDYKQFYDKIISKFPNYDKYKKIELRSCSTGLEYNKQISFAKALSIISNKTVIAPETLYWFNKNGSIGPYVSGKTPLTGQYFMFKKSDMLTIIPRTHK